MNGNHAPAIVHTVHDAVTPNAIAVKPLQFSSEFHDVGLQKRALGKESIAALMRRVMESSKVS
jgi:hypothetical protein